MITQGLAREFLSYDPETGHFTWIKRKLGVQFGSRAGTIQKGVGYRQVVLNRKIILEHRLVWIFVHGSIPDGMWVDHVNCIKDDNRLTNLRLANRFQNAQNAKKPVSKTRREPHSKWKGVTRDINRAGWLAKIRVNGTLIRLGRFDDERGAAEAYIFAALEYHGEFARLQ